MIRVLQVHPAVGGRLLLVTLWSLFGSNQTVCIRAKQAVTTHAVVLGAGSQTAVAVLRAEARHSDAAARGKWVLQLGREGIGVLCQGRLRQEQQRRPCASTHQQHSMRLKWRSRLALAQVVLCLPYAWP